MSKEREEKIRQYRLRQPEAELKHKADKAVNRVNIWTAEELDYADVCAARLAKELQAVWS